MGLKRLFLFFFVSLLRRAGTGQMNRLASSLEAARMGRERLVSELLGKSSLFRLLPGSA